MGVAAAFLRARLVVAIGAASAALAPAACTSSVGVCDAFREKCFTREEIAAAYASASATAPTSCPAASDLRAVLKAGSSDPYGQNIPLLPEQGPVRDGTTCCYGGQSNLTCEGRPFVVDGRARTAALARRTLARQWNV